MSKFLSPVDAVQAFLATGNKNILQAVDPKRKDELKKCLELARIGTLAKAQAVRSAPQAYRQPQIQDGGVSFTVGVDGSLAEGLSYLHKSERICEGGESFADKFPRRFASVMNTNLAYKHNVDLQPIGSTQRKNGYQ